MHIRIVDVQRLRPDRDILHICVTCLVKFVTGGFEKKTAAMHQSVFEIWNVRPVTLFEFSRLLKIVVWCYYFRGLFDIENVIPALMKHADGMNDCEQRLYSDKEFSTHTPWRHSSERTIQIECRVSLPIMNICFKSFMPNFVWLYFMLSITVLRCMLWICFSKAKMLSSLRDLVFATTPA